MHKGGLGSLVMVVVCFDLCLILHCWCLGSGRSAALFSSVGLLELPRSASSSA